MLNPDNIYRMKDNSLIAIYNIIKNRLETEELKPSVEAIFIVNLDILKLEIDRRGLNV